MLMVYANKRRAWKGWHVRLQTQTQAGQGCHLALIADLPVAVESRLKASAQHHKFGMPRVWRWQLQLELPAMQRAVRIAQLQLEHGNGVALAVVCDGKAQVQHKGWLAWPDACSSGCSLQQAILIQA